MSSSNRRKKKILTPNLIGTTHIESSPIDLIHLREYGVTQIRNLFDASHIKGLSKHLIWDATLIGPLNYIIPPKLLSELGINARSQLTKDEQHIINSDCDSIIFMVYPQIVTMRIVSAQIVSHSQSHRHCNYYLYLMPRGNFLCKRALQKFGALGSLAGNICDINIEWYPIEGDLLSLHTPHTLAELVHGNLSSLTYIANALNTLQTWFGKFPIIRAKGDFACAIVDILKRLTFENDDQGGAGGGGGGGVGNADDIIHKSSTMMDDQKQSSNKQGSMKSVSQISQCVIIDRTVDMITPCLSPQTYEGLLHKVFNIENSLIKVEKSMLGKSQQKAKTKNNLLPIVLNSSDMIYRQIRDRNFNDLGKILGAMAQRIQSGYEDRHNQKTSKALNSYIKNRFKNLHADHSLVEQHIFLSENMAQLLTKSMKWKRKLEYEMAILAQVQHESGRSYEEYIEEMIGRGDSVEDVMQFLILLSICQGGITSKKYDIIRKDIVQTFGLQYVLMLELLERYQLISRYETLKRLISYSGSTSSSYLKGTWNNVSKIFQLVKNARELRHIMLTKNNDLLSVDPSVLGINDVNIIGNGYAPLSARLVEAATLKYGWRSFQNQLTLLKGRTYICERMMQSRTTGRGRGRGGANKNMPSSSAEMGGGGSTNDLNDGNNNNLANAATNAHTHKTVLVMFVGGVTYAEISAIRMLENRPNSRWKFIIATTDIADNKHIMNAFIDQDLKATQKTLQHLTGASANFKSIF